MVRVIKTSELGGQAWSLYDHDLDGIVWEPDSESEGTESGVPDEVIEEFVNQKPRPKPHAVSFGD